MAENLGGMGSLLNTNLLQAATKKLLRDVERISQSLNTQTFSQAASQPAPSTSAWNWQPQQAPPVPAKQLGVGGTAQATTQTTQAPRLAAASAVIGGIATAAIQYGQSKMAPQLALNALQVQSNLGAAPGVTNAASFTQTRVAALGTGRGSGQIFAQNTTDALMGYSTLQQIAGTSAVSASAIGRAATIQTGAVGYTNPGMSMKQAANVSAWLYNPMTSLNMLRMGYPIQPRTLGRNNAAHVASPALTVAGMLLKWGNGRIQSPAYVRANLAQGQVFARNLQFLGAPQGFGNEMLAMDQLYYGGSQGKLKPMKVNQVNQAFTTLTSTTATANQKLAVENQLSKYGVTKSEVMSIQTANAVSGESVSDQSSAFAQSLKATTNTLTTIEMKISATLKSSGADTAMGHVGGTTGAISSNIGGAGAKAKSAGGFMGDIAKFTHDIFGSATNVVGGGAASTAGYDMGNLLNIGQYLMSHGYSRTGAAGIAGCIAGESGGNPESSGSGGDGLIGWTPPSTGPKLTGNAAADLKTQEAGIVTYNNANGAANIKTLNNEPNAVAAADYYSQTFERPAVTDSDVRSSVANQIFSELSGASTSNGSSSSAASGSVTNMSQGLTAPLLGGESSKSTTETATILGAVTGGISAGSGFYGDKGSTSAGFNSMTNFAGSATATSAASNGGGGSSTSSSATGTAPGSGGGSTSGYDMANLLSIGKYMMSHGYQRAAAAGIAGCVAGESGGNPESVGSGGDGLIGWTPPSTGPALTGNAAADLITQEAGIVAYNNRNDAGAIATLNAETNPVSAADYYSQTFERPAVTDSDVRSSVANSIYSELAGTKTTGSTGAAATTSGSTPAGGSSTATGKAQSGMGASVHAINMGASGLGLGTGDTTTMGSESELEATEGALGGGINVMGGLGQFGITLGGENGTTASGGATGTGKAIAAYAKTFATGVNHPYKTGGTSPTSGWDCTYFAAYVYYHFGIEAMPGFTLGEHNFACATMWPNDSSLQHTSSPVVGGLLFEAGADGSVASPGHVGVITSTSPLQMVAAADQAEGTVFETPTQISGYAEPSGGFPGTTKPGASGTLSSGGGTSTASSKATSVNPKATGGYGSLGELLQVGERGPELVVDATAHTMADFLAVSTAQRQLSLDLGKGEIELTLPPGTDLSDTDKVGGMLADMLIAKIASNAKVRRAVGA